jgi:formylglycine-generating enzyme required for sulfatase activity
MGAHEVTLGQWAAVMGAADDRSKFSRGGTDQRHVAKYPDPVLARYPVNGVSWDDAQDFMAKLNATAGDPGWEYRLPTAHEWEYACRGGPDRPVEETVADFYTGYGPTRTLGAEAAWFGRTREAGPQPVGKYPPNRLGLYDMHGNVFEHLADPYRSTNNSAFRRYRGGWWADLPEQCTAQAELGCDKSTRRDGAGFRVVRVLAPELAPPPRPKK